MLIQPTSGAILRGRKGALDGFLPARLGCFQFAGELSVQRRLRACQRCCYLLLNLIGGSDPRLALGGDVLFVPPRFFLKRFCRGLRLPGNLRLRLFCLRLQPCCYVLAVFNGLPQSATPLPNPQSTIL